VYGVKAEDGAIVNVNSNWWGMAGGPNQPGADSVYGSVADSTPLGAPPAGLLAPVARFPVLAAYQPPLPAMQRATAAAPAPSAAQAAAAPVKHERRPARALAAETQARQARRPALPASLRGIRRTP
jgi:hypothetical protein